MFVLSMPPKPIPSDLATAPVSPDGAAEILNSQAGEFVPPRVPAVMPVQEILIWTPARVAEVAAASMAVYFPIPFPKRATE